MNTTLKRMRDLVKRFTNKEFRQSYVESQTKQFLATQMRFLRGDKTQEEFAKELGTTQSIISRYEDTEYGKVTIATLLEIACKLDIALIVRFATYSNFLQATSDLSEQALKPRSFGKGEFDALIKANPQLVSKPAETSSSTNYIAEFSITDTTQTGSKYPELLKAG